ncbi:MAG: hypothetical protein JSU86_14855, partial [Phycisphaerales bacterium]
MFERRLKVLLGLLGIALLCIVARLGQLQIVQAEYYRKRAEQSLTLRPRQIPFVRGSILDRTGEVLVRDEPCWGLTVDYSVIAADVGDQPAAIKRHIKRWKRARRYADATTDDEIEYALRDEVAAKWVVLARRYPDATTDQQIEQAFRDEVAAMWADMAEFSAGLRLSPAEEPRLHARDIYDQVVRIRRVVRDYRGFDAPIAEETTAH